MTVISRDLIQIPAVATERRLSLIESTLEANPSESALNACLRDFAVVLVILINEQLIAKTANISGLS